MKNLKRKFAIVTALCMGLTLFPMNSFATTATDISNHWAKESIQGWMDKGLIKGYKDGTFRPNDNITRAEFMALVNNAFGYIETTDIQYSDVDSDDWYAEEITKAKAAGYISGYKDNTIKPNEPIKRGEAAAIIMKIIKLEESDTANFTDEDSFDWSKEAIDAVSAADIMSGYPDGSFKAKNLIKRGEAVASLDKALAYSENNSTDDNTEVSTNHIPVVENQIQDLETSSSENMSIILATPGYEVFTDSDGDYLTYEIKVEKDSSSVVKSITPVESGLFTIIPQGTKAGTATISVKASDGKGGTVTDRFNITFKGSSTNISANHAPVVANSISDLETSSSENMSIILATPGYEVFTDSDGDYLTYKIKVEKDPSSVIKSITPVESGYFTIIPNGTNEGTATISVTASDGKGGTATDKFNIIFTGSNTSSNKVPVVANPIHDLECLATEGEIGIILATPGYVVFTDADGYYLTYTIKVEKDPSDVVKSVTPVESGYFTIIPQGTNKGTATISITADDGKGGTVTDKFNITFK